MSVKKLIGAVSGSLSFPNAEGGAVDISKVTGLTLVADNAAIGNVTLDPATGKFTGNGIAAGDLTLTANAVNDAGAPITGTLVITFAADTTATSIAINLN